MSPKFCRPCISSTSARKLMEKGIFWKHFARSSEQRMVLSNYVIWDEAEINGMSKILISTGREYPNCTLFESALGNFRIWRRENAPLFLCDDVTEFIFICTSMLAEKWIH